MENNNQLPPSYSQPQPQTESSNIRDYWIEQMENVTDFKNRQLPLARIKKIMKADPDVHMVSADAPVLFAKACEMFIMDLTSRSWRHAEENKHHTLQKSDISAAVASTYTYDFLLDVVPKDVDPGFAPMPHPDGVPQYYYPPGIYPSPPTQAWPEEAGEEEDEAEGSGRNGGGN
ncbi:PREDICTED: nuclear transcription factor Y subunit C-6-like [Camelina sativa]|uniref:Nuclear transcription factor Y subunit C-6-like n=1 Tax=Camelina sativa TaxID=90675 RepID=A0ABM0X8Q6_CAMSA|nr:PREDICTED: nuclear transcription factor Y subunit C-6-like [Camelina sativa]